MNSSSANWPPPPNASSAIERKYKEALREQLFQQKVALHVLEHFADDLHEAGFSTQEIQSLGDAYGKLSEEQKLVALAYPAALRMRLFEKFLQRIRSGEITPEDMVMEMYDKAAAAGFKIAFHLSDADIQPQAGDWKVVGKEKDHRHNDLPMAYYSLDYTHRYLTKPSRFLYVIRMESTPDSGHYQDNNGHWGHASTLAIVDKIDMLALEKGLDEQMRTELDAHKNEKREAA